MSYSVSSDFPQLKALNSLLHCQSLFTGHLPRHENKGGAMKPMINISLLYKMRIRCTDIVAFSGFACDTGTPETRRAQQEQDQSHHHPSHQNHWEGKVISSTNLPAGTWHWKVMHLCPLHVSQIDISDLTVCLSAIMTDEGLI